MNLYDIAWVIIGRYLGLILALIFMQIVKVAIASDPLLSMLLGSISTNAGMIAGYFFGNSVNLLIANYFGSIR